LFNKVNTKFLKTITTPRLILRNSTTEILEKILAGFSSFGNTLQIQIPDHWTEFGSAPFQFALDKVRGHPEDVPWWSWLPILVSENMLIGNAGYKGPPNEGMVEIGYEVATAYRNQGFATEMAYALVKNAFMDPQVNKVIAHTLAAENPSVRVLRKCGFTFVSEVLDPDDGLIWRWELNSPV
jgi:[ribosomal protein S5]-alanine N-acetyltransferase